MRVLTDPPEQGDPRYTELFGEALHVQALAVLDPPGRGGDDPVGTLVGPAGRRTRQGTSRHGLRSGGEAVAAAADGRELSNHAIHDSLRRPARAARWLPWLAPGLHAAPPMMS
jgi:hypothetical protein